jgi:hypothetical protein
VQLESRAGCASRPIEERCKLMKRVLGALRRGKVVLLALMVGLTLGAASTALALNLHVEPNQPPLTVNPTAGKATNLNADRLLGRFVPILRAQQDADRSGYPVTGTTEVNRVAIEVPVEGVLMISGTAYVNSSAPADYILNPKVDGSEATPAGWGAYYFASGSGDPGSRFTLSYTVSEPVSAGSHTVSQELGPHGGGRVNFFYNNNELSVMFVPGSQAAVHSAAATAAAQSAGTTPTGQKR